MLIRFARFQDRIWERWLVRAIRKMLRFQTKGFVRQPFRGDATAGPQFLDLLGEQAGGRQSRTGGRGLAGARRDLRYVVMKQDAPGHGIGEQPAAREGIADAGVVVKVHATIHVEPESYAEG